VPLHLSRSGVRLAVGGCGPRNDGSTATSATPGAEPRRLGIPGEERLRTSTDFLELDALPRRVALVGARYIAFEFAHIARRAGAEIVMLGKEKALAQSDQDQVQRLVAHTQALGVDVRLDTPATAGAKGGRPRKVSRRN
jgi:pyruvate/2-oxoglutarate dehydrogenase complex dihydrolipoamide dehydrogenase (E3) component